jgi:HlyD family secretion protein
VVAYRTEEVRRGSLTVTVTATGALEPLTKVNVGTEISGSVDTVCVNFNDQVKIGQVLATINTDKLSAQAQQARATLESAKADVLTADATLADARRSDGRTQELFLRGLVSPSDRDVSETALQKAEAAIASAHARVSQSQASLNAIEADLRKATIRSPIDGIVLDRQVDPGQTVAASFQTPTLFTLAKDLAHMTLSVNVDEADIGRVKVGQDATFTVDAYANRAFPSRVVEVHSTATTVSGVVTYETILSVDNTEGLLRPGMTATASMTVTELTNALLVPNAALRFTPPAAAASPTTASESRGLIGSIMPRGGRGRPSAQQPGTTRPRGEQTVWVLRDGQPAPVSLTVGASDGKRTEVLSGDITEGTPVIVDSGSAG